MYRKALLVLALAALPAFPQFTNARKIQGRPICTDAPTAGQSFVWDGTAGCWKPSSAPVVGSTLTNGTLPKATATGTLADSPITDDGTTVTVTGRNVAIGSTVTDPASGIRGPSSQLVALAAGMVLPAATAPSLTTITGTNTLYEVLDFPDADGEYNAQFAFPLPYFSTITATLRWRAAAAATGSVVWQLQTACAAAGESGDPAFNAAQTVTDAASAGTELNDASIASVTTTGCATGETMFVKVIRQRTHESDDLNQKPQLVSVKPVFN